MNIKNSHEFNEVIRNKYDTFYMYIDLISYLSSTPLEYKNEGESYYFRYLNKDDKLNFPEYWYNHLRAIISRIKW